mmetsp:Transcript_12757/g.29678  ORF Transcript_12757/g.29678 Transcript_12757/m.29678 type:complete len:90 (+) Transcript_12757:486-755(+)
MPEWIPPHHQQRRRRRANCLSFALTRARRSSVGMATRLESQQYLLEEWIKLIAITKASALDPLLLVVQYYAASSSSSSSSSSYSVGKKV